MKINFPATYPKDLLEQVELAKKAAQSYRDNIKRRYDEEFKKNPEKYDLKKFMPPVKEGGSCPVEDNVDIKDCVNADDVLHIEQLSFLPTPSNKNGNKTNAHNRKNHRTHFC